MTRFVFLLKRSYFGLQVFQISMLWIIPCIIGQFKVKVVMALRSDSRFWVEIIVSN